MTSQIWTLSVLKITSEITDHNLEEMSSGNIIIYLGCLAVRRAEHGQRINN